PSWIIEVRDDGPGGGYKETPRADGRTNQRWSRLPVDPVIAVAQEQGRFFSILGWRRTPSAKEFERTYIDFDRQPAAGRAVIYEAWRAERYSGRSTLRGRRADARCRSDQRGVAWTIEIFH